MEAIVLVGGKGTRLRPLTIRTPKPMLRAAGVPFLTHLLTRVRDVGVDHVVLATSYKPEVFAAHYGDGASLGLRLDYVTEAEPLGRRTRSSPKSSSGGASKATRMRS